MDAQQFTTLVQDATGEEEERARRGITATLATLAERLSAGEARDVAEQLPPELAPWLATNGPAEAFGVDEFLRRVAERAGVDPGTAERYPHAVFEALGRVVSDEEIDDMAAELPSDFEPLVAE